ncbi:hypothetical protein [Tenuibacillus multivorans]|uniref:Uncharacterized protein n=1 Tax=Tenuibacillus multivorans TaxID=237069 RepID=A0A1G9YMZ8_9BACI|nr:hypothetical protein [Tenuibacillus multivorans]GEL78477.1 hypothetical protein TMU01_27120 [Tenuibacillus multivorans]SDN10412.1 hypothetical protein SAMN05216498_1481 [Tenuibacillus multivorans]
MVQFKLYNVDEIESLKRQIKQYQTSLNQLKSNQLASHAEKLYDYQEQITNLERVIKTMQEEQEEQNVDQAGNDDLLKEIQLIKRSINDLENDMTIVKERVKKFNSDVLLEEIKDLLEQQQRTNTNTTGSNQRANQNQPSRNRQMQQPTSSFRQLQNFLSSSRQIELAPNNKKKI